MAANPGFKHHQAKATDAVIEKIRREYIPYVNGYKKLSQAYGYPIWTIRDWCQYHTRRSAGG